MTLDTTLKPAVTLANKAERYTRAVKDLKDANSHLAAQQSRMKQADADVDAATKELTEAEADLAAHYNSRPEANAKPRATRK